MKTNSSIFGRDVSNEDKLRGLFRELYAREIPAATSGDAKRVFSSFLESSMTPSTRFSDFSFFSSLFLLRKGLPAEKPDVSAYLAKLGVEADADRTFMSTIDNYVPMLFAKGWDRHYSRYCETVSVSLASCTERSRGEGGARAAAQQELSYDKFLELCLTGSDIPPDRKVSMVYRDGKYRLVTVASLLQGQLLPLHLAMYDHLSKNKWILRGDAKVSTLREFKPKVGEVFVSGDYESATDNFNAKHSRRVLEMSLFHAHNVPEDIKRSALDSLTGTIWSDDVPYPQVNGQLMGNFLSFPLLCLTNFLTVVHSLGWQRANSIPLKINGDDIVFRATQIEADKWASGVQASGLRLSVGKTLRHWRFFSINSAFFCASYRSKFPRIVPVVRTSTLVRDCSTADSLAARAKCFSWGWSGKKKRLMQAFALDWHHKVAESGVVSWTRGRGLDVGLKELAAINLLQRELDLLERPPSLDRDPESRSGQSLESFVEVRDAWSCRDCRRAGVHSLAVFQAKETWEKEFVKVQKATAPEVRVKRRRVSLKRWIGCSWRTYKRYFQRNRRGMSILWAREWRTERRRKVKNKTYIDTRTCCDRCWWACEEERSKIERPHFSS